MLYSFSDTARSERQFAAMLLPHLLMADNFAGAGALFERLGLDWNSELPPHSTEAVAELNPIRDVARFKHDCRVDEGETELRTAVPDLFLRNGDTALVIEAKFFTHPSGTAIAEQLDAQKAVIRRVLPSTLYASCQFHYLALTVLPIDDLDDTAFTRMTWSEMVEVLEPMVLENPSPDKTYALYAIRGAIERSRTEANTSSIEVGRERTIHALIAKAPTLLEAGCQYVGFVGGLSALAETNLKELETRDHYKYSDCQPNTNWIPLSALITKYLEVKAAAHAKLLA